MVGSTISQDIWSLDPRGPGSGNDLDPAGSCIRSWRYFIMGGLCQSKECLEDEHRHIEFTGSWQRTGVILIDL